MLPKKVPVQQKVPVKQRVERVPVQWLPSQLEQFPCLDVTKTIEEIQVPVPFPQLMQILEQ